MKKKRDRQETYRRADAAARKALELLEDAAAVLPSPVPRRGELPRMSLLRGPAGRTEEWLAFNRRLDRDRQCWGTTRDKVAREVLRHIQDLIVEAKDVSVVLAPAFGEPLAHELSIALALVGEALNKRYARRFPDAPEFASSAERHHYLQERIKIMRTEERTKAGISPVLRRAFAPALRAEADRVKNRELFRKAMDRLAVVGAVGR